MTEHYDHVNNEETRRFLVHIYRIKRCTLLVCPERGCLLVEYDNNTDRVVFFTSDTDVVDFLRTWKEGYNKELTISTPHEFYRTTLTATFTLLNKENAHVEH